MAENAKPRAVETEIAIDAAIEDVWAALTEASHLENWFPTEAEVKPGKGGRIGFRWRDYDSMWALEIAEWEPGEKLVLTAPPEDAGGFGRPIRQEFTLRRAGGKTVLHLVDAGFTDEAKWDELYDGTVRGWAFELRGLRHYVERHFGQPRHVAWVHQKVDLSFVAAWQLLKRMIGLEGDPSGTYRAEPLSGEVWSGTVLLYQPPKDFVAVIRELDDGLLRAKVDWPYDGGSQRDVNLWLSLYGDRAGEAAELEAAWRAIFDDHLSRAAA